MAETTLNQPGRAAYVSEQVVHEFGPDDGAALLRDVATARAIFRAVLLAVRAQADESIRFENNGVERWHSAVDAACHRLVFFAGTGRVDDGGTVALQRCMSWRGDRSG